MISFIFDICRSSNSLILNRMKVVLNDVFLKRIMKIINFWFVSICDCGAFLYLRCSLFWLNKLKINMGNVAHPENDSLDKVSFMESYIKYLKYKIS